MRLFAFWWSVGWKLLMEVGSETWRAAGWALGELAGDKSKSRWKKALSTTWRGPPESSFHFLHWGHLCVPWLPLTSVCLNLSNSLRGFLQLFKTYLLETGYSLLQLKPFWLRVGKRDCLLRFTCVTNLICSIPRWELFGFLAATWHCWFTVCSWSPAVPRPSPAALPSHSSFRVVCIDSSYWKIVPICQHWI